MMKAVTLECGGKSPHIILADAADLNKAATQAANAVFGNQGDACNAGTRLLVEESVRELEKYTGLKASCIMLG